MAALDRVATLDEAVLPGEMVAALDSALTAPSRQSRDDLGPLALLSTDPDARDRALITITHESAEACVDVWSRWCACVPARLAGATAGVAGLVGVVSGDARCSRSVWKSWSGWASHCRCSGCSIG